MGFGVLEDSHLEHVPGTALLEDLHDQTTVRGVDASRLKHDKDGNTVLVPQVTFPLFETNLSHLMIPTIRTTGHAGRKGWSHCHGSLELDTSGHWVH
jgi:hypothetical protein